jgi:hypothetical protein
VKRFKDMRYAEWRSWGFIVLVGVVDTRYLLRKARCVKNIFSRRYRGVRAGARDLNVTSRSVGIGLLS